MRRRISVSVVLVSFALLAWGCPDDTDDSEDTGPSGDTGDVVADGGPDGVTDTTDDGGGGEDGGGEDGGGTDTTADGGNDADACMPTNNGTEICDNMDNDCDGDTDECCTTYYKDDDQDGFGENADKIEACGDPGQQYAEDDGDCDDLDSSVNPDASESCNGVDDDCDGQTDEEVLNTYYEDQDEDGYGTTNNTQEACSSPGAKWASQKNDCDDLDSSVNPGQSEICGDSKDNDCDGTTNENCGSTCYRDSDGDGWGTSSDTASCSTSGYVSKSGDCDDQDSNQNPGLSETCDGIDNDCDGQTDECCQTYYGDDDGDGYGEMSDTKTACSQPSGYVTQSGDCLDSDSDVYPNQTSYFSTTNDDGGWDYDCNGMKDHRWTDTTASCIPGVCRANRGWRDGTMPDCGDPAEDYLTGCSSGSGGCQPNYTSREQECR